MGHVWKQTRNVEVEGLVHEAFRDIAPAAETGRVLLPCCQCFYYTKHRRGQVIAKYTKKRITCLQCMADS